MNQIAQTDQKAIKGLMLSPTVQNRLQQMLGKNASSFTTSILQIVNQNQALTKVDPNSILSVAFVAASLNLPLNNNLGFAYIIPYTHSYKTGKKDQYGKDIYEKKAEAQFQIGYKGFIQLAQRSGQFKRINACPIYDQDTEQDVHQRLTSLLPKKPQGQITGYIAYFELLNGYTAHLSMTTDEIQAHANKYSKAAKKDSGLWVDNFHAMAQKTVIKLLLSKQAPLSIEMQTAVQADQAIIKDINGEFIYDYQDNPKTQNQTIGMTVTNEQMPQILALTQNMPIEQILGRYDLTSEQTAQVYAQYQTNSQQIGYHNNHAQ